MGQNAVCKSHRWWTRVIRDHHVYYNTPTLCNDYYGCITKWLDRSVELDRPLLINDLAPIAVKNLNLAVGHYYKGAKPPLVYKPRRWGGLQEKFDLRRKADTFKRWVRESWTGKPLIHDSGMIYDSSVVLFPCIDHGKSLCPTSLILAALDSLQKRYSTLLYATVADVVELHPGRSLVSRVNQLDTEIVAKRAQLGNTIYSVLNAWHSLFISRVITMPDDLGCIGLYREIEDGLEQKSPGITSSKLFRLMGQQPSDIQEMGYLFETVGMNKTFGAPIIDGRAGLNVMREHGCYNPGYDMDASKDLSSLFRRDFCQAYYTKKGTWPNVQVLPSCNPIIVKAIQGNYWPRASEMRNVHYTDFDKIEFRETFKFDYSLDVYDLLSDKACTPKMRYWTTLFDPCGFRLQHGRVPPRLPAQDRRVISNFLRADEDVTIRIVEAINSGQSDKDDDIVRLVPKEGELKESARMFSVVTFERKLYVGLLGSNMSQHILPMFSSQTMTDSEITFLKKISKISSETFHRGGKVIIFVLDIKRFNLRWVMSVLLQMLCDLDNLVGMDWLFQDLHAWFQRCTYIYSSRTRPPGVASDGTPLDGPYSHSNHFGGIEGQGQKIWTLAIQLLIKKQMHLSSLRGTITGQGDNQIIVARLTADQAPIARTIATNFLGLLADELRTKNVVLNETESWYSKHFLESNKEALYDGVQLPNGLKYAAKVSTDANDAPNTFETRISSISTSCEAVCKRVSNPDIGYLIGAFETITQCFNEGLFGNDINDYEFIPAWTTSLGGLPVPTYTQLTMRGYPDRLAAALSFAKYIFRHDHNYFNKLSAVSPLIFRHNPSMELLLMDPHAFDLVVFLSTSGVVRDAVKRMVKSYATNPSVVKYFSESIEYDRINLVKTLTSLRPYAAHLSSELYRCSNVGLVLQYTALFDNNRTMLQMAQHGDAGQMLKRVRSIEEDYKEAVSEMLKRPRHTRKLTRLMVKDECPTKMCIDLRRECYGFEVHGGTNALPCDQVEIVLEGAVTKPIRDKSILVTVSDDLIGGARPNQLRYGPFRAYLGSKTIEKVVKSRTTEIPRTKTTEAALRLTTLLTWVRRVGNPDLVGVVQGLIDEKNVRMEGLAPIVTRGNIFHRLNTPLDSTGCITNAPLHMMTHTRFSTSTMEYYQVGEADWTIFFQALFQYIGTFVIQCAQYTRMPRFVYATLECPDCTSLVPGTQLTILNHGGFPGVVTPLPAPLQDTTAETMYISVAVGAKMADAVRRLATRSVGDQNDLYEDRQAPITNMINLSDFRKCDIIEVVVSMLVRSPYMLFWCRSYRRDQHSGLIPNFLVPLADCILRTGRLEEVTELLSIPISYEASKKVTSLAKQLFLAIIQFSLSSDSRLPICAGRFFEGEMDWIPRRLVLVEDSLLVSVTPLCIGSKQDVGLKVGDTPTYIPRPCSALRQGVQMRQDCSSIEHRVVHTPSLLPIPSPMYHLSRGMGRGSSAASKYYTVLCDPRISRPDPDGLVCLADGCGGVLSMLLHVYPGAKGIFNTLMESDVIQISEPSKFIPSALVGCGILSRVHALEDSILGPTDITTSATQRHVLTLLRTMGRHKELLLTMDAESSRGCDWRILLQSTLNVFESAQYCKKTAIIKLLIPEEEMSDADAYVRAESEKVGYKCMWVKPCNSMAYNHEFFVILQDCLPSCPDTPPILKQRAIDFSVRTHLHDLIQLGASLRGVASCLDIPSQDLLELTELNPTTLTARKLKGRISRLLTATWEDLEADDFYLEMIRMKGRENALLCMVLPLLLLHTFWAAGVENMLRVFLQLRGLVATVVFHREAQDLNYWPETSPYHIRLRPADGDDNVVTQCKRSMKKVMRAMIALHGRPRPSPASVHPKLRRYVL